MLSALKNHPFAVEAFFESSLVLTFALPKEQLQSLIPECLTLDTFQDQWSFVAVAMVQTKSLRPKGFPAFMGNNFFLIGYRIFVRYTNAAGKRLRGLYILKSETDKRQMQVLGNLMTHYRYQTIRIHQSQEDNQRSIHSPTTGLLIKACPAAEETLLPPASPFATWKEARRFAGPLPFTFSYNPQKKQVVIVEGVRQHWQPAPATVQEYYIPFLESEVFKGAVLASAFIVQDIPYHWKKGKTELWNG